MGDSDDDRRFRRRNDYDDRRGRDFDSRRPPPNYGGPPPMYGAPPKRPYDQGGYQGGRGGAPPPKRTRDWGEDTFDPVLPKRGADGTPKKGSSGPILMSFKQFLGTQDDSITDEDAIKKYGEYKMEHKRQEMHAYFIAHKDEEWFAGKYQPDLAAKAKEAYLHNVSERLAVFEFMKEKGWIDKVSLDADDGDYVTWLMDALVVKLEGGSDDDVDELAQTYNPVTKSTTDEGAEKSSNGTPATTTVDGEDDDVLKEDGEEAGEKMETGETKGEEESKPQGKELHRTSSIFLRNVAPSIKKSEIEELCKRFPGFLRVGLADPSAEREFARRGWISFRRDVNIKEICWNLTSIRIKDCDFGAIVNRDLARRIRFVNGATAHKTVAQNDLRQATRLCQIFDRRANLYQSDELEEQRKKLPFDLPPGAEIEMGIRSANPLLNGIEDMLIEEASAEEDEYLGRNADSDGPKTVSLERDAHLLKTLDRILIYLRIVHSVDYYNHTDYPHEDEMPNRCGLMHLRGAPPSVKEFGTDEKGELALPEQFITDFTTGQTKSSAKLMEIDTKMSDEEVAKMGKKDVDKEVEAFITVNCVELSKDKWMCPLSGKKFKGPEFVRKHITGKHAEKLEEVAQEVAYFNNYLLDTNRPLPPPPDLTPRQGGPPPLGGGGGPGYGNAPMMMPPNRGYNQPMWDRNNGPQRSVYGQPYRGARGGYNNSGPPRGGRGGYNNGPPLPPSRGGPPNANAEWTAPPSRSGGRELVSYKDLDAPDDVI